MKNILGGWFSMLLLLKTALFVQIYYDKRQRTKQITVKLFIDLFTGEKNRQNISRSLAKHATLYLFSKKKTVAHDGTER
jgi:hypothetical protein